jgi:hypothetical protein
MAQPNNGMQLTRPVQVEASQLIPSVRQTWLCEQGGLLGGGEDGECAHGTCGPSRPRASLSSWSSRCSCGRGLWG